VIIITDSTHPRGSTRAKNVEVVKVICYIQTRSRPLRPIHT